MGNICCIIMSIYQFPLAAILLSLAIYLIYVQCTNSEGHKVLCTKSTMTSYVLKRCQRLASPPNPPLWARNGHIQTLLAGIKPKPYFRCEREYVLLKDGGVVAIDWGDDPQYNVSDSCNILIIIPGTLSGSVSNMCCVAASNGYRPVVFNKRGHGDSYLMTPKLQTYGDPSDFRYIVKYIKNMYPRSGISAVAYGMGTNLLFSYLGEYGSSCHLSAAVCISPGYDAEYLLDYCVTFPYTYIMLYMMKRQLSKHVLALSKNIAMDEVIEASTLKSFEECLHCRPSGFTSLSQYWEKNNPMREVDEITIPVLCINSLDDPICKQMCIPYSLFTDCPNFMLVISPVGGHCGFCDGLELESWADHVTVEYITAVLGFLEQNKYATQFS